MDWTGYPKNLAADAEVSGVDEFAAFLGLDAAWTAELTHTFAAAPGTAADQLSYAFPREWRAWSTWLTYGNTPPTAAQLVDALSVIPDAPADPDAPELLPVQLARLQANTLPTTEAAVTLMYREPGGSQRTVQWRVPVPAVEVDARLLATPSPPAVLTVRVTVQDGPA